VNLIVVASRLSSAIPVVHSVQATYHFHNTTVNTTTGIPDLSQGL
jgi:hypothetical protein